MFDSRHFLCVVIFMLFITSYMQFKHKTALANNNFFYPLTPETLINCMRASILLKKRISFPFYLWTLSIIFMNLNISLRGALRTPWNIRWTHDLFHRQKVYQLNSRQDIIGLYTSSIRCVRSSQFFLKLL